MLSDNVLLEIFDFYRKKVSPNSAGIRVVAVWKWRLLAQVCRRWRQIIFQSPHRLNIEILRTHETPVRENLHIWPTFPIVIACNNFKRGIGPEGEDNIIPALGHSDRVSRVSFRETRSELDKMVTVMQVPFPVLTRLEMRTDDRNAPVLPAGFLGGSAPRLVQAIVLDDISFPTLPKLLLSTSNLKILNLSSIPPTGYISPEEMVMGLAALTRLEEFSIDFQPVTLHSDQIHSPPVTRIVLLPALTTLTFHGACVYLENLVARIDSPRLDHIDITLNETFDAPVAQLTKFLDRSMGSKLTLFRRASVHFYSHFVNLTTYHLPPTPWRISCDWVDVEVSNIAQSFRQYSTALSNVVHLKLDADPFRELVEGTDDIEWLNLLRQFPTLQSLHVSQDFAGPIALALEALALEDINVEMVAEVLPSLDLIYLEDQPASSVENFVAARQISDHPVTIADTTNEFNRGLKFSVGK